MSWFSNPFKKIVHEAEGLAEGATHLVTHDLLRTMAIYLRHPPGWFAVAMPLFTPGTQRWLAGTIGGSAGEHIYDAATVAVVKHALGPNGPQLLTTFNTVVDQAAQGNLNAKEILAKTPQIAALVRAAQQGTQAFQQVAAATKSHVTVPVRTQGANMRVGIEEFSEKCTVAVKDGVLTASCVVWDPRANSYRKLSHSVDLRPAVDFVAHRLHDWHRRQHEAGVETHGFFDDVADYAKKAASVVSSVAENKTVQALYNKAAPYMEAAVRNKVPGGDTLMDTATKAHDLYNRAKQDHPDAIAAVKKLVGIAETGHPDDAQTLKAKYAVNVMKQASAMTAAKEAGVPAHLATAPAPWERDHRSGHSFYREGLTRVVGSYEDEDMQPWHGQYEIVGDMWGGSANLARQVANMRRGGIADHRSQPGGWQSNRGFRTPAFARHAMPARAFHPAARPLPPPPQDDDDGCDDDQCDDDQVQGYLHHPYRHTADRITEMKDHPGLGLATRELYNMGLGRSKTDWTDIAASALAKF